MSPTTHFHMSARRDNKPFHATCVNPKARLSREVEMTGMMAMMFEITKKRAEINLSVKINVATARLPKLAIEALRVSGSTKRTHYALRSSAVTTLLPRQ